jgi:hypothetical protein
LMPNDIFAGLGSLSTLFATSFLHNKFKFYSSEFIEICLRTKSHRSLTVPSLNLVAWQHCLLLWFLAHFIHASLESHLQVPV